MSDDPKIDFARGWRHVQALRHADEIARIEKLGDDELAAELKADGLDAVELPGADALVAIGEERARAGKDGKGVDAARGWRHVEKLRQDDIAYAKEVARIEAMGDTQLEAEMRAEGLDPDSLPSAEEIVGKAAGAQGAAPPVEAKVVSIAPKRGPSVRLAWIAAAAVAASGIGYGVISQFPNGVGAGDHTRAEKLRDEAVAACSAKQWAECRAKLDDAMGLDPAGEEEQRVKAARAAIEKGERGSP